jgi:dipeptidyl aminopeptidase/acylaminoacyl peptidase
VKSASQFRHTALRAVVVMTAIASTAAQDVARKAVEVENLREGPSDTALSATNVLEKRSISLGGQSVSAAARPKTRDRPANPPNPALMLHGRIVFHRYTNYDAWDGHLYLFDFGAKRLRCLSERREIDHAINGNFSPDGKHIVFMGVPRGQHRGNAWDVYLWKVDSRAKPVNLTAQLGTRDEDPRFAPDGKRILFKQDGEIRIMDLTNREIRSIPFGGA